MDGSKSVPKDLITIITKVMANKIYGSVEIFFHAGKITQITERTINKLTESDNDNPKATKNPKSYQPSTDNPTSRQAA